MRLIDADAFFNDFSEMRDYEWASQEYEVDAEPVRHGRLLYEGMIENTWRVFTCSVCGCGCIDGGKYCPNCGAKMDGGADDVLAIHEAIGYDKGFRDGYADALEQQEVQNAVD